MIYECFLCFSEDVFMSGCTVFVFLSLMEYALVNIVMGDIADIEKKKSMGISNLILGSRGLPIRSKEGGINQEVRIIFLPTLFHTEFKCLMKKTFLIFLSTFWSTYKGKSMEISSGVTQLNRTINLNQSSSFG